MVTALANPVARTTMGDSWSAEAFSTPTMILHGDNDKSVPLKQSQDFHDRYKEAGLDATMKVLPKTGHVSPNFTDAPRRRLIKAFYDKHLRQE